LSLASVKDVLHLDLVLYLRTSIKTTVTNGNADKGNCVIGISIATSTKASFNKYD